MIHKMTLSQFNIIAYIKHHMWFREASCFNIDVHVKENVSRWIKISQKLRLSNVLYNTIMDFNNLLKGKKLLVLLHHMKNNCAKKKKKNKIHCSALLSSSKFSHHHFQNKKLTHSIRFHCTDRCPLIRKQIWLMTYNLKQRHTPIKWILCKECYTHWSKNSFFFFSTSGPDISWRILKMTEKSLPP